MAPAEQPGDRARIETLLQTFDAQPDELHLDITPSVLALIDLGLPGLEAALDRLNARDALTRKRAQRVLDGVIARFFGWKSNVGYPTRQAEQRAHALIEGHGYSAAAEESERLAAIARWRTWLAAERAREEPRS